VAHSDSVRTLSVVVPVYNEAATLRTSIERLLKAEIPLELDVLVVDDGSTDASASTIGDLVEDGSIRLLRHDTNLGKGAAVRTGIAAAMGDVLTIMDADLEYDPNDYAGLLSPLVEGEAKIVYGTRTFGSHTAYSFWYVLGNRFVSLWASFLFNGWLSDIETCFKVAQTSVWRSLNLRSRGFGIEAEITGKLLKRGHRIFEVPIRYRARGRAEGKKLRASDGLMALWLLLRIRLFGRPTAQDIGQ
jgi:glycosyltransferase involved in cell wall biosynthesis